MIDEQIIKSIISPFKPTFLEDYQELYQDNRFVSIDIVRDYFIKRGSDYIIDYIRCEYNDGENFVNFDLRKVPGKTNFYVKNKTFTKKKPFQHFEYIIFEDKIFTKAMLVNKKRKVYIYNSNSPAIVEETYKGNLFTFYLRKKPYLIEEFILSQFTTIDQYNPLNTYIDNETIPLLEKYLEFKNSISSEAII